MSTPLFVTKEKRKEDIKKIKKFVDQIPISKRDKFLKLSGSLDNYICYEQFVSANFYKNTTYDIYGENGHIPYVYYEDGVTIIWFNQLESCCAIKYYSMMTLIMDELSNHDIKKWIIDFRGNSGGDPMDFITVLSWFMGDFVLDKKCNDGSTKKFIYNKSKQKIYFENEQYINQFIKSKEKVKGEICVVINRYVYSAGEFSAYLLRKSSNAKIYGFKSGGLFNMPSFSNKGIIHEFPFCNIVENGKKIPNYITPDVEGIPDSLYKI